MNNITGWMNERELIWLKDRAAEMDSVVEVGCYAGHSTFELLSGCKGLVTVVDNWTGSGTKFPITKEIFLNNVGNFNNLRVLSMDSLEAARLDIMYDMVFIDANHSTDAVRADIKAWIKRTRKLICGHDYDIDTVKQAVDSVLGDIRVIESIWYKYL